MIVRNEKPSDIDAITQVIKTAFQSHSFNHQTEHYIIRDLRAANALTLSLVTEIDGRIVGHIAFSPVTISDGTPNWFGLGPVSVLPDYQGCRIGMALVNRGLALMEDMGCKGCALVGLPTYYRRFGFRNHPELIHRGVPQEVFVAKPLAGQVPGGILEFHPAFKQLSGIEKQTVSDAIIDFEIDGIRLNPGNPAIEGLIQKKILTQTPDGRFMIHPSALAAYDPYFSQVAHFRATEMSRVHKNPIMTAIRS